MAIFAKCYGFVEHVTEAMHNFKTDQYRLALSNTDPDEEEDSPHTTTEFCYIDFVTEIDYTNCGPRDITTVEAVQSGGRFEWKVQDQNIETTNGDMPAFQWIYVYNTTNGALVGYWNYGLPVTLLQGQHLIVDYDEFNDVVFDLT